MKKTTKMVAVLAAMSVMILGAATMVSADEKQGWVKQGSDWYYYVDGDAIVNNWALAGSDWYFLGEEGKMVKEKFVNHDDKEVVGSSALNTSDDIYYVGKDGAMVTGWFEVELSGNSNPYTDADKAWYYFGDSGVMYADEWVLSNNLWYYLDGNSGSEGQMVEYAYDDTGVYYLGKGGAMITGWYKTSDKDTLFAEDKWLYAGTNGKPVKDSWKKVDGSWYYFGNTSGSATNAEEMNAEEFITEGGHKFYLKKSGAMSTGWVKVSGDYYYSKSDGVLFQDKIEKISGKYYFFNVDGKSLDGSTDVWAAQDSAGNPVGTYANENAANTAAGSGGKIFKIGTGTVKDVQ